MVCRFKKQRLKDGIKVELSVKRLGFGRDSLEASRRFGKKIEVLLYNILC